MLNFGNSSTYSFFAAYGQSTLRFDVPANEIPTIMSNVKRILNKSCSQIDERKVVQDMIRKQMVTNGHMTPRKSQAISSVIVYYLLSGDAANIALSFGQTGFALLISSMGGENHNFRTAVLIGRSEVDQLCETYRQDNGSKPINVPHKPMAKAKSYPQPPSQSVARPQPEQFLLCVKELDKNRGGKQFQTVEECINDGICFAFPANQLAEGSEEEVNASLSAMVEFDRLHLPYDKIWLETTAIIEFYNKQGDLQAEEFPVAVAAYEMNDVIQFYGFVQWAGQKAFSPLCAEIDKNSFLNGKRFITTTLPSIPDNMELNENIYHLITEAAGNKLLELLFLLSTKGVNRKTVSMKKKSGKKARRKKQQRDYTIIRVPMVQTASDGTSTPTGRWVRPHVRRAHMWGKNTRPVEEQQWREATLVGASTLTGDEAIQKPEYIVKASNTEKGEDE